MAVLCVQEYTLQKQRQAIAIVAVVQRWRLLGLARAFDALREHAVVTRMQRAALIKWGNASVARCVLCWSATTVVRVMVLSLVMQCFCASCCSDTHSSAALTTSTIWMDLNLQSTCFIWQGR